jgi:hypothetical protein
VLRRLALVAALAGLAACDRNIEPFDPNEVPEQPDLSRIFPEGADRAPVDAEPTLPPPPRGAPPVAAAPGAEGAPIRGTLRIAAELAGRVPDGAVLFLIARRGGAGPPLAVQRIAEPRFPLEFSIGPDDRMLEAIPFAGPLELSARIDADGNAMSRQPGDLEGRAAAPASPGALGVAIEIDAVLGEGDARSR